MTSARTTPRGQRPAKKPTPAKRAPRKTAEPKPPLISDNDVARILAAIKIGLEPERAAVAVGLTADLLEQAIAADTGLKAKIEQMLAVCELNALDKINRGVDGWQAFRWLLERKYPERYGFKQYVVRPDQAGDDGEGAEVIPETRMDRLRRERQERARRAAAQHA